MTSGHGDDRHLYPEINIRYDFSSNVPAHPDHSALWAHLNEHQDIISRYPEPEPYTLEAEIAKKYDIDPQCVLVTNGATEAIFLVAHLLKGKNSGIVQPTFSEYMDAAMLYQHRIQILKSPYETSGDLDAIWCCNPNNPTGTTWEHQKLIETVDSAPETTFIYDQSYHSFTPKEVISHQEVTARPNVIAIFSLTKKYALPGLRLGYLVTSKRIAQEIRRLRMPWSVNALAIEAGHFLLHRDTFWKLNDLLDERLRVTSEIEAHTNIQIHPTDTHYFLAQLPPTGATAQELKDWLVLHEAILIRNADNFPTLTPHHFRIAIQSPEDNNRLISSLIKWTQI
ncbi:aminotransferase class I/II-fold pyridoxal phosphate-dependent enzyme [Porphyromonadaceae bacterium W3.11]|nr:aminotransferase class I/II-fold pyridoxal phosphate-dependent enzyme [Porphyromonadaceae bacterium W3.11]